METLENRRKRKDTDLEIISLCFNELGTKLLIDSHLKFFKHEVFSNELFHKRDTKE